ncbi:MAG: helix-turn-helix domain-containing protein [Clostridia bacterium]|nr:helix-turn-helix domain-containing protein [Clostridia bacterium]
MFSKNLRFYRLRKNMTKAALAEAINVTPMAITHYEDGSRQPNMEILSALADVLGVRVADFLTVRDENITFRHAEFRKAASLKQMEREYIRESVEDYFSRFMTTVEILGGEVLPNAPECHVLRVAEDDEKNAAALRDHLGFASDGPIEGLIGKLEKKGILIYECPVENAKFSGMNGFVNERPYIVLNPEMNAERNRSTAVHELAHLMFAWPEGLKEKEIEARATAIGGAFLFPKSDAIRELGVRRSFVSKDMELVAEEYGISMMMLVTRAKLCGIISAAAAEYFYVNASRAGWRTSEPSRIKAEHTSLFEQLVYRAVNEEEVSVQRGAELLRRSYADIQAMKVREV